MWIWYKRKRRNRALKGCLLVTYLILDYRLSMVQLLQSRLTRPDAFLSPASQTYPHHQLRSLEANLMSRYQSS